MINNKNRDRMFFYSLIISIVLHGLVLFSRPGKNAEVIELPSKKAGVTFINFSIKSKGLHHGSHSAKENKNINRENRVKTAGDLQVLKPGTKRKSSSKTPASLSKNPVISAVKTYKSRILSKIQRMKYYPITAKRMNQEGVVLLRFILNKDGTLAGAVKVIKGCKHELLNRAGVKTIRKSLPFPSFPDSYLNDNIEFNVQLVYNLDLLNEK
jgi:TonB family protein